MRKQTEITPKQIKALKAIYNSLEESGFPPTLADLREDLGVVSNQSVLNFLDALEEKGYIEREGGPSRGVARGIRILPLGFKILGKDPLSAVAGTSSAGPLLESFSNSSRWMTLPGQVLEKEKINLSKDDFFVIQVFGDSMINAGIDDGDFLLVRKTNEFGSGDIVVARGDDGTTVKRFITDGKRIHFQPENPKYKIMPFYYDMHMDGKVVFNLSKGIKIV